MRYKISKRQYSNAKKLGVKIKPSTLKNKKIDVFKSGKKIASIGDIRYNDFSIYLRKKGKAFAQKRQKAYKSRHNKTRRKKGSRSYYTDRILWE